MRVTSAATARFPSAIREAARRAFGSLPNGPRSRKLSRISAVVADGVNSLRGPEFSALVITHHQRLLDYLVPNRVHVLTRGRIVRSGGPDLAKELEKSGYAGLTAEAA